MLLRQLRTSLIAQATWVIGLLLIIALLRSMFAMGLSWMSEHDDAAIETAHALHSSVYRLTLRAAGGETRLQPDDDMALLQQQLQSQHLREALDRPGREELQATWERANRIATRELLPALDQGDNARFLRHAGAFGAELDQLAAGLQDARVRLQRLDLRQVVVIMLLVISLQLLVIYILRIRVARPLDDLLEATEKLRAGNLDVRMDYQAADEIGRLAASFNMMAEALATTHRGLEERMQSKLHKLAQANAALELLFRSSHSLAHSLHAADALQELLQRFQTLLPGLQLQISLEQEAKAAANAIAIPGTGPGAADPAQAAAAGAVYSYPIRNQGLELGEIRARCEAGHAPAGWEDDLIRALADLVGSALVLQRQRQQDNQLLLFNERNTIARELHDSLAQSLSFMKLQISRLQALILQGKDCHAVEAVAEELRTGINDAYAQLRELLTTFRLEIGEGGLGGALQAAVQEFSRLSNLDIRLQADVLASPLSDQEKVHMVQIMREALANCVRHAEAVCVEVVMRQAGDEVELIIEDDGCGMAAATHGLPQHGIAIMQERARSIGGTLLLEPRQPRGTRVHLRFRPRLLTQPSQDATP